MSQHSGPQENKENKKQTIKLRPSRRSVIIGAASGAVILGGVGIAGGLYKHVKNNEENTADKPAVIDKSEYEDLLEFANIDSDLSHEKTVELPLGCVINMSAERYAAVLERADEQLTLSYAGILDTHTGTYRRLITKPQRAEKGKLSFSLYEVRCSDSWLAWLELNYETYDWVLFAAPLSENSLKEGVVQLVEGTKDTLPPEFLVFENKVLWQEMPHPNYDKSKENSKAFLWEEGAQVGKQIASSRGHFACSPQVSDGVLTLCPRELIEESNYYVIKAFDLRQDLKELQRLVMPKNVRPTTALYADGKFGITVEASYNYGGLLGHLGSFYGTGEDKFFALLREPYAPITYINKRLVIKNRTSLLVFDLSDHSYFRLAATNNSLDWGDFCVQPGVASKLISYATVKSETTGLPDKVIVRIWKVPEAQTPPTPQEREEKERRRQEELEQQQEADQPLEGADGSREREPDVAQQNQETESANGAPGGQGSSDTVDSLLNDQAHNTGASTGGYVGDNPLAQEQRGIEGLREPSQR